MSLGFGFMIRCSLSNYFPLFYHKFLHTKIQNTFTYFIFITSASVLHISVKLSSPYPNFRWKYHQSCPHYSALTNHELLVNKFSMCFMANWYSSCLLKVTFLFPVVRSKNICEESYCNCFRIIFWFVEEVSNYCKWLFIYLLFRYSFLSIL